MIRSGGIVVAVVVVVACAASTARADERSEARDHYVKGTKAFDLGAYDEAINEYSQAYRLHDDPALLYNIAQAHRLAGHSADALRFYRMFLVRSPNSPIRGEVEQKITELQKLVEQQKKTENMPPDQPRPPEATPPTEATPTAPSSTATTPPAAAPAPTADRRSSARTMQIAGLATAAVGVAALAVGGAFAGLAVQASNDLTKLDQNMGTFDPAKQSAGKTDQLLEGVFFGIGGAAVVAGVIVFVLGRHQAKAARVAVTPVLSPRLAGAAVEVRF